MVVLLMVVVVEVMVEADGGDCISASMVVLLTVVVG